MNASRPLLSYHNDKQSSMETAKIIEVLLHNLIFSLPC
jgi:hypothetical protein